ncbi:MAG: TIM barrel protein, partial [Bacillota bacterium]
MAATLIDPRLRRCSICVETLFTELPLVDRIKRVAERGFGSIEFWGWRDKELSEIRNLVDDMGVKVVTFCGNRKGSIVDTAASRVLLDDLRDGISAAKRLGCETLILLADELSPDGSVTQQYPELSPHMKFETAVKTLSQAAKYAEDSEVTLVLEPLNTLVDHPGYYIPRSKLGFDLIRRVNSPNLKLLYDIYHMQIMEGNLISTLTENVDLVGHVHVADVPGRNEPGTGEINYP